MNALLASAIAFAGVVLITLLIWAERTGRIDSTWSRIRAAQRSTTGRLTPTQRKTLIIAFVVGVLAAAVTGWVVLIIVVPAAAIGLPWLLGGSGSKERIDQLEALETWTRSLSGLTSSGRGSLEQVLIASLQTAPPLLHSKVERLVALITARWSTDAALREFAESLDDPTADLVVAHLLLAERTRGPGLTKALDDLAEIIYEEVKARRQIETDRAKTRTASRIIVGITVTIIAAIPFIGQWSTPYRSPIGQLLITVYILSIVGVLLVMKKMTAGRPATRILKGEAHE